MKQRMIGVIFSLVIGLLAMVGTVAQAMRAETAVGAYRIHLPLIAKPSTGPSLFPMQITVTDAEFDFRGNSDDRAKIDGSFTLTDTSDGVYFLTETVTVTLGNFSQVITPGSFMTTSHGFRFDSEPPGIKRLEIFTDDIFFLEIRDIDLSGFMNQPLTLSLQIGNDLGHIGILGDPGSEPPPITGTIPFNGITLTVKIDNGNDRFEVDGSFSLITSSNGIHPLSETVWLTLNNISITIPSGSFVFNNSGSMGEYAFQGLIDGVDLEVRIRPITTDTFEFFTRGEGADVSTIINPVTVTLIIGDEAGSVTVIADIN